MTLSGAFCRANSVAAVKETFAATTTLREVEVLAAVRQERRIRRDKLSPICVFAVSRSEIESLDWKMPPLILFNSILPEAVEFDSESGSYVEPELDDELKELLRGLEDVLTADRKGEDLEDLDDNEAN